MSDQSLPPALPHGFIREVLPDIFMVSGEMNIAGRPVSFSRNMTVVRDGTSLTLVNSVRLSDSELGSLEQLGSIDHVIRLAGFHGRDDAFYKQRYGAHVYAVKGQVYVPSLDLKAEPTFTADTLLDAASDLPFDGARLYVIDSNPPEALLLLLRDGGTLISGDALQNWHTTDRYFNLFARVVMRLRGFVKPCNVGPGWFEFARPPAADLRGILDLRFENVLPAHGEEIIGDAKQRFAPAIVRAAEKADAR